MSESSKPAAAEGGSGGNGVVGGTGGWLARGACVGGVRGVNYFRRFFGSFNCRRASGYAEAGEKQWGHQSAGDQPLVCDIDGDGKSDLVVRRGSTGTWYWLTSSSGYSDAAQGQKPWGSQSYGDIPLPGPGGGA